MHLAIGRLAPPVDAVSLQSCSARPRRRLLWQPARGAVLRPWELMHTRSLVAIGCCMEPIPGPLMSTRCSCLQWHRLCFMQSV